MDWLNECITDAMAIFIFSGFHNDVQDRRCT